LTLCTDILDPIGVCIDPLPCRANHSCDPNAAAVFDGARLSFRSLKPIEKDEEVFISYIDGSNPFSRRQHELKDRYHFTCNCSKCERGATLMEDSFLLEGSALGRQWKDAADAINKTNPIAQHPENYVGTDTDSQRLAGLQAKAFDELAQAKYQPPYEAIRILENGMRICHDTKLWPLTRQPYPALRHEWMVNMIATGKPGHACRAWQTGVKIYFLIDPVLYPQEHHPVRVVHMWMLATLTMYLSTIDEEPAVAEHMRRGVNFTIVMWELMRQVRELVGRSHGDGSKFAREVRRRLDEVHEGMRCDPSGLEMVKRDVRVQWRCLRQMADGESN